MIVTKDSLHKTVLLLGIFLLLSTAIAGCATKDTKEAQAFEPGQDWLNDMRSHIDRSIPDANRKSQLLDVIDQFEQELDALDRSVQDLYENLVAVDLNYHSTADDFRKVFDDFHREKRVHRNRFVDLRFQMVALTTAEEWKKMVDISNEETLFLNWKRQPEIK